MHRIADLFAFAQERENIRLRREAGEPPPWTDDPVLQRVFFCNVYREDDKTTRWFREHIRDQVAEDSAKSVLACTVFRWFNHVPTGEILAPALLEGQLPPKAEFCEMLSDLPHVISGAYLIKSPPGQHKAAGLWDCIEPIARDANNLGWAAAKLRWTLEHMHQEMMVYPYLGRFMAYEVVTDLRHTCVLRNSPDTLTWASAGPGAARGAGWVVADDPSAFSYASARQQRAMLHLMSEILGRSREVFEERPWEMREVEHVLCEFSKYRSAQVGGKPKRKFDADRRAQRAPGPA